MQQIEQYGAWRAALVHALDDYRAALSACALLDAASLQRAAQAARRLHDDRLSVAFVAEFSRGKSELINAMFFADYGQRMLPSAAGRTTMCPTELLYDAAYPPCLRLLPIATRLDARALADYRDDAAAWRLSALALDDPESMRAAFAQLSLTQRVTPELAQRYGLYDPDDATLADALGGDGLVEIPAWRHALVNLPHPLLKHGLVILDTPGLNAIGTEPELTLNLIPNAHAVLFVLAADTGVTRSDIDVWRSHIGAGPGRLVVLNKIDTLWDTLRSAAENEAELARQQYRVAEQLGLDARQVHPVSAHKALVARIQHDPVLFERSRLGALETALMQDLIPQKRAILSTQLLVDLALLESAQTTALAARARELHEQAQELAGLRGKNRKVLAHMIGRIEAERQEFDSALLRLREARTRCAQLATALFSQLDLQALGQQADSVRAALQTARFGTAMRAPVRAFFDSARISLNAADAQVAAIGSLCAALVRDFATEHGLRMAPPVALSLAPQRAEIDAVEALYNRQFGTATLFMTSRATLLERFFASIAARLRRCLQSANADVEAWLKVVNAPLETQIRQHKEQLRQRLSAIQRIDDATDSLEQKIGALSASQDALEQQRQHLAELSRRITTALSGAAHKEQHEVFD